MKDFAEALVRSVAGRAQVISRDDGYFLAQLAWSGQR